MGNIINIKNINVSYGKNHVLKDVNIDIKEKDFFTFLGPSGCGKTTLLRLTQDLNNHNLENSLLMEKKFLNLIHGKEM